MTFGASYALAQAHEHVLRENNSYGLHCEPGCVACAETADALFSFWLTREYPLAAESKRLSDLTPRVP